MEREKKELKNLYKENVEFTECPALALWAPCEVAPDGIYRGKKCTAHIALPFFIGIMLADDSMKRLPVSAYPIEMVKQELRSSMFDCQLSTSTTTVVHMCSGGENRMSKTSKKKKERNERLNIVVEIYFALS